MKTILGILVLAASLEAAPDGWQFHKGQAGKPAVLLIHGLAASKTHFTEPRATWSIKHAHFDHRKPMKDRSGTKSHKTVFGAKVYEVRVGIESVRISPKDDDAGKKGSLWSFLVGKGYSVAVWNQIPCMDSGDLPSQACKDSDTFEPAYATAKEAFAELVKLSEGAPIALLGHSRGGLIARKLLKEDGLQGRDQVKWLITLHSPHQGSSMATMGVELQKILSNFGQAFELDFLPKALHEPAEKLLPEIGEALNGSIDMLVTIAGMEGARELAKNGETIKGIETGETKPAGMTVVTFGGSSPKIAEAYLYLYDGDSALPSKKGWKADGRKILNYPASMKLSFPEMKEGGDLLVTDAASRLPWEDRHYEHALNHAEVLWSQTVQDKIHAELKKLP